MPPEGIVTSDTMTTWKKGLVKPQGSPSGCKQVTLNTHCSVGERKCPLYQWGNVTCTPQAPCVVRPRHTQQYIYCPNVNGLISARIAPVKGIAAYASQIIYHPSCPYNSTLCILHDRGSVCQPLASVLKRHSTLKRVE